MSMDKNSLASLLVIYSLQNQNRTTQARFGMTTRNFPSELKFFPAVSPLLIKKNLKDSWSQSESGLITLGLIIYIGAVRMFTKRPF